MVTCIYIYSGLLHSDECGFISGPAPWQNKTKHDKFKSSDSCGSVVPVVFHSFIALHSTIYTGTADLWLLETVAVLGIPLSRGCAGG